VAGRARFEKLVQRLPADQREDTLAAEPVRATLLDPRRPARDLLEHLLDGIASCHLLYSECGADDLADDPDDDEALEDEDEDADDEGDAVVDVDVEDEASADAERREEIAEEFAEPVCEQAAPTRTRLS
jgi:hypothetical protein